MREVPTRHAPLRRASAEKALHDARSYRSLSPSASPPPPAPPLTHAMPRLRRSVSNLRERLRKASVPNLRRQAAEAPEVPPIPDVFSRGPPPPPAAPVSPPVLPPSAPLPGVRTPERSPHYVRRRHMSPSSPDERVQSPWSFAAMIRRLSGDDVQMETYNSKNSLFSSDSTSSTPTSVPSVEYLPQSPVAALRNLSPPAKAAPTPAAAPACVRASPPTEQPRTTRLRRVPPPALPLDVYL